MITIQDHHKNILGQGGDDGSVVQGAINARVTCILYIDYDKGGEDGLDLTFDEYFKYLDSYYPLMYEDSDTSVARIEKKLNDSGKYRILIALGDSGTKMRVNAQFINNSDSDGNALITVAPMISSI